MTISIYGSGCNHCKKLLSNVKVAIARLQQNIEVEYITDLEAIADKGFLRTPGLMVNATIVSQGKVLAPIEIEELIQKQLSEK
jgi:small redox-active disulfide protein 2